MRLIYFLLFISASNYREKNPTDLQTKPQKFTLNDDDFDKTFNETLAVTLQNIVNNQFRNMKKSVHGKAIIGIANQLRENIPVKQQVEGLLKPVFKSIFSAAADDGQNNETLFGIFYEKAHDPEVNMKLKDLLSDIGDGGKLVRPFIGVMLHQLMSDLIGKQASMFRRAVEKTDTNVSEYDQTVLYYVSGYITSALFKQARQVGKRDSVKQELLKESLGHFLKKESDSEKTFVEKNSKWTEKVDRGGLKVPSDDFFLFIRECEMACRESVDQKHLHSGTYNTVTLKEKIMERYMVKHYIEKLAKGKLALFVIEKCISLFLTVRGHAAAKRKRQELLKSVLADEKKAVHKVLKEKSANAPAKK